MLALFVKFPTM